MVPCTAQRVWVGVCRCNWPGSPGTGGSLLPAPAAPAWVSRGAEAAEQHGDPAQSRGSPNRDTGPALPGAGQSCGYQQLPFGKELWWIYMH